MPEWYRIWHHISYVTGSGWNHAASQLVLVDIGIYWHIWWADEKRWNKNERYEKMSPGPGCLRDCPMQSSALVTGATVSSTTQQPGGSWGAGAQLPGFQPPHIHVQHFKGSSSGRRCRSIFIHFIYIIYIYIILYISYIYMDTYILVHSFPFFMTWCNPSVCIRLSHESKCSCKVATVETQLVVRQESSMHDFNLWVPRRFSVWAWVMTSMTSAPSSELCFLTHGNSWKILLAACSFQI